MVRTRSFGLGLLLAASALGLSGCGAGLTGIETIFGVSFKKTPKQLERSGKKARVPKNLHFRFLSKSSKQQIAELRLPGQQIYAPFRLEARIGDFSTKQVRWTEANERMFINDPNFSRSSHLIRLTFAETEDTTDATVTISPQIDRQRLTDLPLTLQDTRLVDIAVEHTGTEIIYFAKSVHDAQFQEIGRAATSYTGPFQFSFDAFGLPKKAEAGIDDLIVVSRTAPPDLDRPQKRAVYASIQAFDDLLAAVKAVDGYADGAATAPASLNAALAHLEDAANEAAAFEGTPKKASKSLAVAAKKMKAALGKLDKGKAPSSTVKLLKVAMKKLAVAIALISDA